VYAFERFSDAAKRLLTLAQEEAERMRHHHIGTEHLLLAMPRVEDGLAAQVLVSLGVDEAAIREALAPALVAGHEHAAQIIPTSRTKKVIAMAFDESTRAKRQLVTTGAVLLAITLEGNGIAAQVLESLGVREVDVRAELGRLSVAGAREEGGGAKAAMLRSGRWLRGPLPLGEGSRVLVHEPEPPHRLWEGRVVAVDQDAFVV